MHTREAAGFRSSFPAEELLREEQEESAGNWWNSGMSCLRFWKRRESLSRTGEEQYFRIGTDENELHNLVHDELYLDRVGKLRELLIHELEGREEGFVKDGRLVTGCEPIVWLTKDGR